MTGWELSLTKRRLLPPQPGSLFSIRNKELTGGKRRVLSRPQEGRSHGRRATRAALFGCLTYPHHVKALLPSHSDRKGNALTFLSNNFRVLFTMPPRQP